MQKRVHMKLIPMLRLLTIFFLMQGTNAGDSHFTRVICYMYNASNLCWISSYMYMYICLISTHELLLSAAAIICWRIFVICMRAF